MNNTIPHIAAVALRRARMVAALAACALAMGSRAQAQPALEVRAVHGLAFGMMFRSSTATVDHHAAAAAVFEIRGKKGRSVEVMIGATDLAQPDGPPGRRTMPLTVTAARCAYSVDDGMSWTTFAPGAAWQKIQIPSRGAGAGRIIVRVGGEVAVGNDQHRGYYGGCISLTAVYE